jgi:hypothetical protein
VVHRPPAPRRTQWALALLFSEDDAGQTVAFQVLQQQAGVRAADGDDARFVADVIAPLLSGYLPSAHTADATLAEAAADSDERDA